MMRTLILLFSSFNSHNIYIYVFLPDPNVYMFTELVVLLSVAGGCLMVVIVVGVAVAVYYCKQERAGKKLLELFYLECVNNTTWLQHTVFLICLFPCFLKNQAATQMTTPSTLMSLRV